MVTECSTAYHTCLAVTNSMHLYPNGSIYNVNLRRLLNLKLIQSLLVLTGINKRQLLLHSTQALFIILRGPLTRLVLNWYLKLEPFHCWLSGGEHMLVWVLTAILKDWLILRFWFIWEVYLLGLHVFYKGALKYHVNLYCCFCTCCSWYVSRTIVDNDAGEILDRGAKVHNILSTFSDVFRMILCVFIFHLSIHWIMQIPTNCDLKKVVQ